MKQFHLFLAALILCLGASCEKETMLTVDQASLSFSDTGSSNSITLTANKPWSASSNQSWCKVSPSGGEEAAGSRISISCDANTTYEARSATVTFTCAELTKTVSVSQAPNNGLLVSQASYDLTKAAQQLEIQVQANVKFRVEVDAACKDWVKYNSTKGLTTSKVVLDIAENESYDGREGKVVIQQEGGVLSSTVTIRQSQLDGLFLSTSEYNLSNEKHTLTVEVSTNVDLDIKPEADWVKYVQTKGLSTKQIVLEVAENDIYNQRETKVNVKQKNGDMSGTITIKQDEKYGILVSQSEYNLTNEAQAIEVEVKYNVDFEVSIPDGCKDWIKLVSTKDLSRKNFTFSIVKNETYDNREGSITFKQKNGPLCGTVSVRQDQKDGIIAARSMYEISDESQVLTIDILANVAYEAESDAAWIKVVDTKGLKTGLLTLEVAENENGSIREGLVSLKQKNGGLTEVVRIIQGNNRFIAEKEALTAFYHAMNGPNWSDNTNWCSDKPVGEWAGIITYDSWRTPEKKGLVYQILLPGIGVSGDFEQAIEALTQLKHLEKLGLQGNPLNCPIPSSIARLKSLTGISLWECNITGTIPEELGELENLEYLELFDNHDLTGPIPASLGNLKKAKWINLSNCNLTGNIPEEITHLDALEFPFDCFSNSQLSGTVPAAFSQWKYWNDYWGHIVVGTQLGLEAATPMIPAFSVTLPDGTRVNSDIVKDHKLTILYQWATWCAFSAEFLPVLKSAYKHFEKEGLTILSWADDNESKDQILKYIESNEIAWPNFIAESGKNQIKGNLLPKSDKNASYPYGSFPSINAFDSNGKLVYTNANSNQMETFVPFMDAWFNSDWDGRDESAYESTDYSRDGHVTRIQTAAKGEGIDIVLIGDAFSDRLVADGTYETQVFRTMEALFSVEPYRSMRDFFNVYSVDAVSKQEFIPGETAIMTNWTGGNPVKFSGDHAKAMQYAKLAVGDERMDDVLIIVLLNLDMNGGTCHMFNCPGGDYGRGVTVSYVPTFSERGRFTEIVVHEAGGHGFAKLADEYTLGLGAIPHELAEAYRADAAIGWWKNVDFTSDPDQVKWAPFIGDSRFSSEEIGVYQGGFTYDWGVYRPTRNSVMNGEGEFNAPSRYAIWYRINKLAYGPEWSGSFEDFAVFDTAHRQQVYTKAASGNRSNYVEKIAPPLAPPVLHRDKP